MYEIVMVCTEMYTFLNKVSIFKLDVVIKKNWQSRRLSSTNHHGGIMAMI